jgi:hypothetical protein
MIPKAMGPAELWIPSYASYSVKQIRAQILTYVDGQTRQAQDSSAM